MRRGAGIFLKTWKLCFFREKTPNKITMNSFSSKSAIKITCSEK